MLESAANSISKLSGASTSYYSLIHRGTHGRLECLPGRMLGVAKLAVVGLVLEILSCSFHAKGLCWLSLIFGWPLHKICIFLFPFVKHLYHVFSQHRLIWRPEFLSVRCCVIERFLCHYFTQNG